MPAVGCACARRARQSEEGPGPGDPPLLALMVMEFPVDAPNVGVAPSWLPLSSCVPEHPFGVQVEIIGGWQLCLSPT